MDTTTDTIRRSNTDLIDAHALVLLLLAFWMFLAYRPLDAV
jgi:hypothetical protein